MYKLSLIVLYVSETNSDLGFLKMPSAKNIYCQKSFGLPWLRKGNLKLKCKY
jgi:hypothetical protein